jgi:hypothetical protein
MSCIPLKRTDVDCHGGSGNGPHYSKPGVAYKVKRGYDRHLLDADRDGWGSEWRLIPTASYQGLLRTGTEVSGWRTPTMA